MRPQVYKMTNKRYLKIMPIIFSYPKILQYGHSLLFLSALYLGIGFHRFFRLINENNEKYRSDLI